MVYDFSTRLDRLGSRMKQLHDNMLTYTRGAGPSITISHFTPERIDVNELAMHGLVLVTDKLQDFVFDYADLEDLDPQEPQDQDVISWNGLTYQVMSVGDEIYRFTTSTRKRIRVHTKQTAVLTSSEPRITEEGETRITEDDMTRITQ